MQARVIWQQGMQFKAEAGSGHSVIIDGAPQVGGNDTGMRPMEMLLLSMAGCSAMDVIYILNKARQKVSDCVIDIKGKRAETTPKVFTDIHVHYSLSGENLDEAKVKNAVSLSAEKYCSVATMIKKAANVSYDYEIK